jgi:hypothetical protein
VIIRTQSTKSGMRLSGRILAIIIVIATSYVVGIMLVGLKGSESFLELVSLEKAMGFKDMAIQTAATHSDEHG